MLKYQLNIKSVKDDLQQLDVSSVKTMDAPFIGDGKMILTCYLNERDLVHEKDTIVVVHDVVVPYAVDRHTATNVENYVVDSVNEEDLSFNIIYDKYVDLDAAFARTETFRRYNTDGTSIDIEYIVIYFKTYHHFNPINGETITVYLSDNVTNSTAQLIPMVGEVADSYTLRFVKDDNLNAYKRIFYTDIEVQQNYASMTYFKVLQENFMFQPDYFDELLDTTFYLQKVMASVSLPLTNTFSTELFNSINVEGFVQQQINNSLNAAQENEKDIYYPVNKVSNNKWDVIRRIKFNFHFRQRPNDNWTIDNELTWNGVEINGTAPLLSNDFFAYTKEENQSDLLGYLDFTDGDVKYRRNVLKKSFARLLFYDSTDSFSQRLIAYSTVFFDTGALLNRYMRNIEKDKLGLGYFKYPDTDILQGVRTNRELAVKTKIDEDDIEDCRLSSQMVVSDKHISSNSSEGFYLYLWKDNVTEGIPGDIFMRVEFNHAKYGRTIPFMMPYDGKIKTFKKIIEECTEIETDGGETKLVNAGYSLEEYRKYSYIHFKYERNEELGYIYYLDPDTYGINAAVEGDSLLLNLYEVNVR